MLTEVKNLHLLKQIPIIYSNCDKKKADFMKRMKKNCYIIILIAILAVLATGCTKDEVKTLESWAYSFDSANEILRLCSDGSAVYQASEYQDGLQVKVGKRYSSYKKDNGYLILSDPNMPELKMRYTENENGIILYEISEYKYSPENAEPQNGLLGLWVHTGTERMFFEFTNKGTFLEDGLFPGYYEVDENNGSVKLKYNNPDDSVPATIFYYTIKDDMMTVEYPWQMVKTEVPSTK